jgi:hypothetical protein
MVIYESLTGNTRKAAGLVAEGLASNDFDITAVSPTNAVDLRGLQAAELVVVGTWTDGILVVGQRPGRADRLRNLPAMNGKQAVVYCTYALNPGKTIDKLIGIVRGLGANVTGGLALHRRHLDVGAADYVDRLVSSLRT